MAGRLTHYEATVYYSSTGSSHTGRYPFLAEHAAEVGVDFDGGVEEDVAKRLIARWNARMKRTDIRYTYRLP